MDSRRSSPSKYRESQSSSRFAWDYDSVNDELNLIEFAQNFFERQRLILMLFQEDLYPDTQADIPAITAAEW